MNKLTTLAIMLLTTCFATNAQTQDSLQNKLKSTIFKIPNRSYTCYDIKTIRTSDSLQLSIDVFKYHPVLNELFVKAKDSLKQEVNKIYFAHHSDTLNNRDFYTIYKPLLNWARNIDPHFNIGPIIAAPSFKEQKDIYKYLMYKQKQVPVTLCNINDSLIIHKSADPKLQRGDLVTAINGVSTAEYLKYNINERFTIPFNLMHLYDYMMLSDSFKFDIVRNSQHLTVTTQGIKPSKMIEKNPYSVQSFKEHNCGYIRVKEFFPNNSHLIKSLRRGINSFKEQGITNVIVDLRDNSGGNGDRLIEILSIFTNKDKIPFAKSQTLRVSEVTIEDGYDYATEDMMYRNVEIPDSALIKEINLKPELHISGLKYYVLVSKSTHSMAAGFANMLHYNNIATLCGEPLLHNALNFGDIINSVDNIFEGSLLTAGNISAIEYNEHTKAIDGVLHPDIHIPYIASEYMTGKDAVLERLIRMIKDER